MIAQSDEEVACDGLSRAHAEYAVLHAQHYHSNKCTSHTLPPHIECRPPCTQYNNAS